MIEDVQRDAVALHSVSSRNYHAGKGSLRRVSRLGSRHHTSCGVAHSFKQVTFWVLPHPHKPSQHICPSVPLGEVWRSFEVYTNASWVVKPAEAWGVWEKGRLSFNPNMVADTILEGQRWAEQYN